MVSGPNKRQATQNNPSNVVLESTTTIGPNAEIGLVAKLSAQVRRALKRWQESLINFDGRNRLLYFNPARNQKAYISFLESAPNETPKLDLALIKQWLEKQEIKASVLHVSEYIQYEALLKTLKENKETSPGQVQRELERSSWSKLLSSYKRIYEKQKQNYDERNIDTCFLAVDFLSWNRPDAGPSPRAPLVLIPLAIKPIGRGKTDFVLSITNEAQINDVLTTYLKKQFDITVLEPTSDAGYELLRSHFDEARARLPEGKIERAWTITNFSFLQMPMVRDLERIESQVEEGVELSNLVLTLAGEEPKGEINPALDESELWGVLEDAPESEFLVFPADQSQHRAIAAVAKGQTVVIQGPPGTGKSQTIANCIAELTARGRRVLFVAEKRAAIDAVVTRLREKDLDSLVLDLHGEPARKTIASQLLQLTNYKTDVNRQIARTRKELESARAVLQSRWGILNAQLPQDLRQCGAQTLHDLLVVSGNAAKKDSSQLGFPLSGREAELISLGFERCSQLGDDLARLQSLGWLDPEQEFVRVASLVEAADTQAKVDHLCADLENLDALWGDLWQASYEWAEKDQAQIASLSDLINEMTVANQILNISKAWDFKSLLPLFKQGPFLTKDQFSREYKETNFIARFFAWRRLDRSYRSCYVGDDPLDKELQRDQLQSLMTAFVKRQKLSRKRPLLPIRPSRELLEIFKKLETLTPNLKRYPTPIKSVFDLPMSDAKILLDTLISRRRLIEKLPTINHVRKAVNREEGIARDLLISLEEDKPIDVNLDFWLLRIYFEVLLRETFSREPFTELALGEPFDNAISKFQKSDEAHLSDNRHRVKQKVLELFNEDADLRGGPGYRLLSREADKKSNHRPFRKLMEEADDVILALKPCFAMSPLNVSRLLPCKPELFDVVIFDEASQIRPEDAIPSIYRTKQVVVAGDRYQLAPSDAFRRDDDEEDEEESDELQDTQAPTTTGLESILDAMRVVLSGASTYPLANHYRSKHETLISFSNKAIYTPEHQALFTFPSAYSPMQSVLNYEYLDQVRTSGLEEPNTREIEAVLAALAKHARDLPERSLGIIAFGARHADRIRDAVGKAEAEDDDIYSFVQRHQEKTEPLFVKNIETVQGDERDYIVISPGYAPRLDGSVALRFGSLNNDGGERRINVAASRAKEGMHLITSLRASDLDLQRSNAKGVVLFRKFLEFMESGGAVSFGPDIPRPETPFEEAIYERLSREGLNLECQWGVSGFRIDFAVRHPEKPDAFVLAIEADGASYHSSRYARERDDLRQKILEARGWQFVRIWSTDWFRNPQSQVDKVLTAYRRALHPNDRSAVPLTRPSEMAMPRQSMSMAEQVFLAIRDQYPAITKDVFYEKWLDLCGHTRSTNKIREQFESLVRAYPL